MGTYPIDLSTPLPQHWSWINLTAHKFAPFSRKSRSVARVRLKLRFVEADGVLHGGASIPSARNATTQRKTGLPIFGWPVRSNTHIPGLGESPASAGNSRLAVVASVRSQS